MSSLSLLALQGSLGFLRSDRVDRAMRGPIYAGRDYGADYWRDDKQPELAQRPPAHKHCRSNATRRIDGRIGNGNADQV